MTEKYGKKNEESHFYKYAKASTAMHILKEGNFLAQSPLNFNDPFDVQIGLHFGFDINNFHAMLYEKMVELIESGTELEFENKNGMSEVVLKLRTAHRLGILSKEKLQSETKPIFDNLGARLETDRKGFIESRLAVARRMRVLCLSTTPNNLLMWSHYSQDHTGVVIKLKVAEAEVDDDPLWLAEKVVYTPSALPLMTGKEILEMTYGIKKYQPEKLRRQLAFVKFNAWEYENEFRFFDFVSETNQTMYTIGIAPERFEAVYFGIKANEKEVYEIKKMALSLNRNIEFYQAKRHAFEFKIEFEKI